jgi:hypothetical protein
MNTHKLALWTVEPQNDRAKSSGVSAGIGQV